jgi:hypothetical protein
MPHLKVTLYIRITTPDGKRKMCKPFYASRGRLKPLYAADAKGNSLGHHPEGEYYLRYAGRTEAVGNDPYVALDRLEERKAELRGSSRADSPTKLSQPVEHKSARVTTLDDAISEYLTTGKAAEKNWRKHTLQCYLMRGLSPAIIYALTAGGEVAKEFHIGRDDPDFHPVSMQVAGNRIAVLFFNPAAQKIVLETSDLEGHHLATYDGFEGDIGISFVCYSPIRERFTFLTMTPDNFPALVTAEPR